MDFTRKRPNSSPTISPPSSSPTPIRRRRFLLLVGIILCFVLFFGVPGIPAYLKDAASFSGSSLSRANIAELARSPFRSSPPVDEIFGLLHLVTGDAGNELSHAMNLDPSKKMDMVVYAGGDAGVNWNRIEKELNEKYPVVVFSKTYCPYSRRAKSLLDRYKLDPPPKIVEVDIREDGDLLKVLLTRLTKRSTFPNVIVKGTTIGGSDDVQALHAEGELRQLFEKAGIAVNGVDIDP